MLGLGEEGDCALSWELLIWVFAQELWSTVAVEPTKRITRV